jgi:hypothetical protein
MAEDVHIDAGTFQLQLGKLVEVLAQKLNREAVKHIGYTATDLFVLLRYAIRTYDLLFYLNADERRETDPHWRDSYTIVTLPLVRNLIDCLFNVTLIIQDPAVNGPRFRMGGLKKMQMAINEDEKRYGGQQEWDVWIAKRKEALDLGVRSSGLKMADVPIAPDWPTLGAFTKKLGKGGTSTPYQDFLKAFLYGRWREYSALAHATFEGMSDKALFLMEDSIPIDNRHKISDAHPQVMSLHLARAAAVLLCMATEVQAHFRFGSNGARINERIHELWNILARVPEIRELYDERYRQLMHDRGISP